MELPSPKVFSALLAGDVQQLYGCSPTELRPFLPCLARIALRTPVATATPWQNRRKVIHALIAGISEVNAIKEYLSVDFQELRQDALKERQLLRKLSPTEERSSSVLASSLQYGLAIEFERSDHLRRFRLLLSEVLRIMHQVEAPFKLEQSDLFECQVHLDEIGDILCIAVAELPSLLPVVQLSEALLRLERGPLLLTLLIANSPDCFDHVVTSLVVNGESLDEVSLAGRCRTAAIRMLCSLHPTCSLRIQSLAISHRKHPTLALTLALEFEDHRMASQGSVSRRVKEERPCEVGVGVGQAGVVTLLHNVIIAGDEQTKAWFAQYMKLMQQKFRRQKSSAVSRLRHYLMRKFLSFFKTDRPDQRGDRGSTGMEPQPDSGTENGNEEEPMEAEVVAEKVEEKKQEKEKEKEKEKEVSQPEEGVEAEGLAASTLEELVDQMEIEISASDHEGAGSGGEEKSKQDTASKPETRTSVAAGRRRRRHSSVYESIGFPLISLERQLSNDQILELTSLLHVCCGLKVQAQMYLTNEESGAILSLIACTCAPFSPAGVRFIQISLSVLLACPFLISLEEGEHAVVRWFQWLLDRLPDFDRECGGHCSYGEMLLLIAIHLRERQLTQIEELISSTLLMKISSPLRSGHFAVLRQLFLKVFTEDVVCAHAVSVPPTPTLSAHLTGYLPIHCVHQLIKTRTFRKHSISIKDWIYQQVLSVGEPLHPTLPPLVQEFVSSVLLSTISGTRSTYQGAPPTVTQVPFTAEEVLRVFRHDPDRHDPESLQPPYPFPSQLLMLYYVLLYQDCYLANMKSLLMQAVGSPSGAYSPHILAQIPVKHLLQHARLHQEHYATLYPSLLRLLATHLPHLCHVEDWLKEEEGSQATAKFVPLAKFSSKKISPTTALEVLQKFQSSPSQALLLLSHLSTLPPTALIPYSPTLTSTLPLLLPPTVSRRIQVLYRDLWTKINSVIPRKLWLETVNALRPPEVQGMRPLTHQNLTEDPLTVLRCDPRVFRCPPVFEILLRILAAYTSGSKTWLQEHSHIQNCVAMATPEMMLSAASQVTKQEQEELCVALVAAQESAIVQLLLEICLPSEEDEKAEVTFGPHLSALREIQCLVCSYLHQAFIAEPSMVKLVHFQGYPAKLLPMMVSGVPSMHICLDFILELLAQPQTDKQQFAIQLAAHIIQQYPLPDAMGIARDIFQRLTIIANEIPADMRELYFIPLLPAVVQLCQTFPPLSTEATEFLVQLSKVCTPSTKKPVDPETTATNTQGLWSNFDSSASDAKSTRLVQCIQNAFEELINSTVLKV